LKIIKKKAPFSLHEKGLSIYGQEWNFVYVKGWNNCREEFLNNLDTI